MLKTLGTMVAVALIAIGASGCDGGDDLATKFCNKAQSCNDLVGSLQECKETLNKALDSETSAQRADDEKLLNQCIAMQACANFETCVGSL